MSTAKLLYVISNGGTYKDHSLFVFCAAVELLAIKALVGAMAGAEWSYGGPYTPLVVLEPFRTLIGPPGGAWVAFRGMARTQLSDAEWETLVQEHPSLLWAE